MSFARSHLRTEEGSQPDAFGLKEWGLLASVALVWGASSPLIAEALESASPALITTTRLGLGAVTLAFVPRARRSIARDDLPSIVLLSLLWMAIPFTLFPVAQQWVNSATAGMLNGAMPIFAAVAGSIMLRRLPGRFQIIGLVLGFLGVVLISAAARSQTASSLSGVALILLATVCYGVSINLAVPLQQRYGSLPVLLRALWFATIVTLPFTVLSQPSLALHRDGAIALLVLGVAGTGLAFVAIANLAGRTGGTRAASAIYVIPVVAVVLGVVFRGDVVLPSALAGIALVIGGAALISRRDTARPQAGTPATSA